MAVLIRKGRDALTERKPDPVEALLEQVVEVDARVGRRRLIRIEEPDPRSEGRRAFTAAAGDQNPRWNVLSEHVGCIA